MNKVFRYIVALFLVLALTAAYLYWDSTMNSPTNFKVTYLDIEDEKIPENFKGLKILYFSDLCYGSIFNAEHLQHLQKTLSTVDYDIVVFGGDLLDVDYAAVSDDVTLLTDFFNSLDARLGKFFILGDFDQATDTRVVLVKKVFNDANFELINGTMKLYNGLSGYITLSSADTTTELSEGIYNVSIIHGTSNYNLLSENVDFVLSGHSHQFQTDFFNEEKGTLGLHNNLYVVRSVGMIEYNYRILNTPEILLIRY